MKLFTLSLAFALCIAWPNLASADGCLIGQIPDQQNEAANSPVPLMMVEEAKSRGVSFLANVGDLTWNADIETVKLQARWEDMHAADGFTPWSVSAGVRHDCDEQENPMDCANFTALFNFDDYSSIVQPQGVTFGGTWGGQYRINNWWKFQCGSREVAVMVLGPFYTIADNSAAISGARFIAAREGLPTIYLVHDVVRFGCPALSGSGEQLWNGAQRDQPLAFLTISGHSGLMCLLPVERADGTIHLSSMFNLQTRASPEADYIMVLKVQWRTGADPTIPSGIITPMPYNVTTGMTAEEMGEGFWWSLPREFGSLPLQTIPEPVGTVPWALAVVLGLAGLRRLFQVCPEDATR